MTVHGTDNHFFETYFFQDNYNSDLNKIKSIIDKQLVVINYSLKNSYSKYLGYIELESKKKIKKSENIISKLRNRERDLVKKRYLLYKEKSYLEESLIRFNSDRDLEIENSNNFSGFVQNEFKLAISDFSNLAKEESDNMRKLYWIMLIRQLNIDFKVVEGKNEGKN